VFREVRYGLMFFLCAMAGLLCGGGLCAGITDKATDSEQWIITGAILGTAAGSLFWLSYKYSNRKPPKN